MLRHEPWPSSPSIDSTIAGLWKCIDQLRGDDADDAAVPALPRHHQHVVGADVRVGLDQLPRLGDDRRLLVLPLRVLDVELLGERPRLVPCASSEASSSRAAMSGDAMRPAALMRGASRKPMWKLSSVLPVSPEPSSSARRPTLCGPRDSRSSPSRAMTRFSPTSGTTSASVPIAAIFRNAGSHFSRPPSGTAPARSSARRRRRPGACRDTAVGALRIDHRERRRQRRLGLVVVGDDQVDARARGRGSRRVRAADAAIDRDDHAARRPRAADRRRPAAGRSRRAGAPAGSGRRRRRGAPARGAGSPST